MGLNAFTSRMSGRHWHERTQDWDATRGRQQGFFPLCYLGRKQKLFHQLGESHPQVLALWPQQLGEMNTKVISHRSSKWEGKARNVCGWAFQYKLEKITVTDGQQWVCNCACYANITEMGCLNHLSQKGGNKFTLPPPVFWDCGSFPSRASHCCLPEVPQGSAGRTAQTWCLSPAPQSVLHSEEDQQNFRWQLPCFCHCLIDHCFGIWQILTDSLRDHKNHVLRCIRFPKGGTEFSSSSMSGILKRAQNWWELPRGIFAEQMTHITFWKGNSTSTLLLFAQLKNWNLNLMESNC